MTKIKIIKSIHLYVSIIIFLLLLSFSLYNKHLNITEISLSKLGINQDGWIWNSGLLIICGLLYFKIKHSVEKFIISNTLQIINKFLIICLVLTALINMNYHLHDFVALAYFLGTSSLIFLFGIKIHKTNFRIGQLSLFIAILSALIPSLSFPLIKTLAMPETIHISLLFLWLIILEHDDYVINIIKKLGF